MALRRGSTKRKSTRRGRKLHKGRKTHVTYRRRHRRTQRGG